MHPDILNIDFLPPLILQMETLARLRSSREIYLRWAEQRDIPDMARIIHRGLLADFELFDHFTRGRHEKPVEFYQFVLHRVRMFFAKPAYRFMLAEMLEVTVQGQQKIVVGVATWHAEGSANPLAAAWEDGGVLKALERQLVDLGLFHHRYLQNTVVDYPAFYSVRAKLHDSYAHDESLQSHLHLQYLVVDPSYQKGFGIGRRLLQWGLDIADQLHLPVILESSLGAYHFYLKHGFEVFERVSIDLIPEKAYEMPILLYRPNRAMENNS